MYDVLVVGGGTAGLTAAIYVLRSGKSVMVVEPENFGGQITFSPKVENFPGFKSISGNEFAEMLVEQAIELGAETDFSKVIKIEDSGKIKKVITDSGEFLAKSVIIATGAKHRHLGIEREEDLSGCGVSYCAACDGAFFKGKSVAVVGGGNAALQSAMHLLGYCSKVYLVHRRDSFRGEDHLAARLKEKENIEFVLDSVVTCLKGENDLSGITVKNVKTGEIKDIDIDGLFIAVGQEPNNEVFKGFIDLDEAGYIVSGEDCKTSKVGIFAAGDCRTKSIRQLTTAAADGTIAALAACSYVDSI
ncbi:MAG: thioredoxin-disulfide reductase [Clostridia bacterium]|nr:thioredoxin-disulfide reductase [Clostridia bacterium]